MRFLLTFCLVFIPLFSFAQEQKNDFTSLKEQAKEYLTNLISIDTAQPEPQEVKAARYIYTILNDNKINWDIYLPQKTRANLVVVLKSSLQEKEKKTPLILISHLDTATIEGDWSVPPIKATLKDGKIYGRGASDAKNYAAINLTILTYLAKNQNLLNRDIFFLFTADEENGSKMGLKYLYEQHPEIFPSSALALNEGGGLVQVANGENIFFIEAASKMYMDILMTTRGDGGNSSSGAKNNAIYKLSQALAKLKNYKPTYILSPFTRKFFEEIYKNQDEDAKTTLSVLLNSSEEKYFTQAAEIISDDPFFETQLRDTITPTIISSLEENNTTTNIASALINCRLLPTTNPQTFFDNISALFEDDEDIILTIVEQPEMPFPEPPKTFNDELYTALLLAIQKTYGQNTTPIAGLSPASSESEILRRNNMLTYGIGPLMYAPPKDEKEAASQKGAPHQPDEYIEEDFFNLQLKLTLYTVLNLLALPYPKEALSIVSPVEVIPLQE